MTVKKAAIYLTVLMGEAEEKKIQEKNSWSNHYLEIFKLIEAFPQCLQIWWVATRQSYNFKPPRSPIWQKRHRR